MNGLSDKEVELVITDIGEEKWGDGGIVTFSGRTVYPMNPTPDSIDIEDIAHALANTCRFSGHCSRFYSVAEHCVNVSLVVPDNLALIGLLHDSAEAYLTDIPRPIKPLLTGYKSAEDKLVQVIFDGLKTGLKLPIPKEIKEADNLLLALEQFELIPNVKYWPHILTAEQVNKYLEEHFELTFGQEPEEAEESFLRAYHYLTAYYEDVCRENE